MHFVFAIKLLGSIEAYAAGRASHVRKQHRNLPIVRSFRAQKRMARGTGQVSRAAGALLAFFRCSGCSLVWLSNAPLPQEMHHHYTRLLPTGSSLPRRGRLPLTAGRLHGKKLTQRKRSGAVLDLGCSSGAFLESLKGESWERYGIEMSAECARRAEARTGGPCFCGRHHGSTFPCWKLSMSSPALTCSRAPLRASTSVLAKVREWLKPGGIFYVQVPNIDSGGGEGFRDLLARARASSPPVPLLARISQISCRVGWTAGCIAPETRRESLP